MNLPWRTLCTYALPPGLVGLSTLSYFLWFRPEPQPAEESSPPVEYAQALSEPAAVNSGAIPVVAPTGGKDGTASAAGAASTGALLAETPETSAAGAATAESPLALAQAEAAFPELAKGLSAAPTWPEWLQVSQPLTRFVRAVDDVALGEIPLSSCGFLRSTQPFAAENEDRRLVQSPASSQRYTMVVDTFCSIDPDAAGALFRRLEPALQDALNSLGYRDQSIRRLLQTALDTLLAVPVLAQAPELTTLDGRIYRWADPALEQLNDAQKLFLRFGPDNMQRIRTQLVKMAAAAGLAERP